MKIYFLTLGCRVNQYETDAIRNSFVVRGHDIVSSPEEADVCVVNTCTVTSEADRKSRQSLRKMVRANEGTIVVATGCAAEMANGTLDADVICGTRDKNAIVDKVEEFAIQKNAENPCHTISHVRPEVTKSDVYHDFGTVLSPEGTRAYIKIEDGCNNFCTYCIIPYARGRVASRPFEDIINEAKFLASKGYKEVAVTGIHTCSYGKDRGEDITALYKVLEAINAIDGIERIRLGSLEPLSMTDEFIMSLKNIHKLCPHFHLSLQSGSDTVLKRMNRHYTADVYRSRVEKLREVFPGFALTTDVICGFPGETDEEFSETIEFVKSLKFAKIHCFPYSVREGTVAAKMKQVDMQVRKERNHVLLGVSDDLEKDYAKSLIGKEVSVLIEKVSEDEIEGLCEQHVRVHIKTTNASDYAQGDICTCKITSSEGNEVFSAQ